MNMHSKTITPRINPQWESFPRMYILGKIPQGLPPTSLRCGVLRPTMILTLDLLPASVPWTAYCLRLTPVSCHTVDSTKPLFLFHSPIGAVPETRHVLISMESTSTTRRRPSWFLINMILLSSHSHSLSHLISPHH